MSRENILRKMKEFQPDKPQEELEADLDNSIAKCMISYYDNMVKVMLQPPEPTLRENIRREWNW